MKVKDIIVRAAMRYNDADYSRLSQSMYLRFLDEAINQLILARPDAHIKTENLQLVPGTRQSIPEVGYRLIAVYRNKNKQADGSFTDGSPVRQVPRDVLDSYSDWHNATPTNLIEEYVYDDKTPKTFWVSQPVVSDEEVYVELDYSYGVEPYAELTDDFDTIMEMEIPIDDVFLEPLISYVLFLLFSVDSSSQNDFTIAQAYRQEFYQSLGIEYKALILVSPKVTPAQAEAVNAAVA